MHYSYRKVMANRYLKHPLTLEERFWAKVDKSGNCWIWLASVKASGYGQFNIMGKMVGAHRLAFELTKGAIPSGHYICHTCDNPRCVNPAHLFAGTASDNAQDMVSKGRSWIQNRIWTHCPAGHQITDSNVVIYKNGSRKCRICKNISLAKQRRLKKSMAAVAA